MDRYLAHVKGIFRANCENGHLEGNKESFLNYQLYKQMQNCLEFQKNFKEIFPKTKVLSMFFLFIV